MQGQTVYSCGGSRSIGSQSALCSLFIPPKGDTVGTVLIGWDVLVNPHSIFQYPVRIAVIFSLIDESQDISDETYHAFHADFTGAGSP